MHKSISSQPTDSARTSLRCELLKRGWLYRDLAREVGIKPEAVNEAALGRSPCTKNRHRIEMTLNSSIWNTPADFLEKRKIIAELGFDPFTVPTRELRERAKQIGIVLGGGCYSTRALIKKFREKAAQQSKPKEKKQ